MGGPRNIGEQGERHTEFRQQRPGRDPLETSDAAHHALAGLRRFVEDERPVVNDFVPRLADN